MIDWEKVSYEDSMTILKIVSRAFEDQTFRMLTKGDRLSLDMDLSAAHATSPLDLEKLLNFPDLDFFHDLYGISGRIDRETGELRDCFLPRCSESKEVKDHVE